MADWESAMLDTVADLLEPTGWEIYDPEMGLSFLLLCPHGDTVEQDGTCPNGDRSPLIALGVI